VPYDKKPWVGEIEADTRAFCACGESGNKPFCDGSHGRTDGGKTPVTATLETTKKYAICMCGCSDQSPFCDGSHKQA